MIETVSPNSSDTFITNDIIGGGLEAKVLLTDSPFVISAPNRTIRFDTFELPSGDGKLIDFRLSPQILKLLTLYPVAIFYPDLKRALEKYNVVLTPIQIECVVRQANFNEKVWKKVPELKVWSNLTVSLTTLEEELSKRFQTLARKKATNFAITDYGFAQRKIEEFEYPINKFLADKEISLLDKLRVVAAILEFNLIMFQNGFWWTDQGEEKGQDTGIDNYLILPKEGPRDSYRLFISDVGLQPLNSAVIDFIPANTFPITSQLIVTAAHKPFPPNHKFYTPYIRGISTRKKHESDIVANLYSTLIKSANTDNIGFSFTYAIKAINIIIGVLDGSLSRDEQTKAVQELRAMSIAETEKKELTRYESLVKDLIMFLLYCKPELAKIDPDLGYLETSISEMVTYTSSKLPGYYSKLPDYIKEELTITDALTSILGEFFLASQEEEFKKILDLYFQEFPSVKEEFENIIK